MDKGPLHDAARMLRMAASRLEAYAISDENTSWKEADDVNFRVKQKKRISEALTNIDAATTRIEPYRS